MNAGKSRLSPLTAVAAVLAILLIGACSTNSSPIKNRLDPATSVMITYATSPMIFYRDVSGRAAFARDYIYLGPIEINRSGDYRYYLWLGIWNILADAEDATSRDGFESIVVFADGEPLPLEVSGWAEQAIGASEPVYVKPIASAVDAYYELTAEQLRLIVDAKDIRLQATGPKRRSYEPWGDQTSAKAGFIDFLGASVY